MLNKTKFGGFVAAAIVAFGLVGTASAATISWSDGSTPIATYLEPVSTTGTVFLDQTFQQAGVRLSPFVGTGLEATTKFNSISVGSSATYAFNSVRSTLQLIWGSVDSFNYIDFLKAGVAVDSIQGVAGARPLTESLASILVSGGFDKVVLRSSSDSAFEYQGVAAVPVPAAGFLLIGALGGLAAVRRRKAST
jgi:hypothetical protein